MEDVTQRSRALPFRKRVGIRHPVPRAIARVVDDTQSTYAGLVDRAATLSDSGRNSGRRQPLAAGRHRWWLAPRRRGVPDLDLVFVTAVGVGTKMLERRREPVDQSVAGVAQPQAHAADA